MRLAYRLTMGTVLYAAIVAAVGSAVPGSWSAEEQQQVASLRLATLESLPPDPSNRVSGDARAVSLGHKLFFDKRLSLDGTVSCATCHDPAREFQDGTPLAKGAGTTNRRTMPIASTAYSQWQFWDGRKDSQWAQALGPLESPVEHGGTRTQYAHVIATHYRVEYEQLFGELPDLREAPASAGPVSDARLRSAWSRLAPRAQDEVTQVYVNVGKSIAAYERLLTYGPSRFDVFADSLALTGRAPAGILSKDEMAGLRLFIGKAECVNCHNGPLFTDQHFHNTGVPAVAGLPDDRGRAQGAKDVRGDEFNCLSRWSDAKPEQCSELEFMVDEGAELERAFKTPSLRNVRERAPYMHAGQYADLETVLDHYNRAPVAPAGTSELRRLRLSARERRQLVAFLGALSAPLATSAHLLEAPR